MIKLAVVIPAYISNHQHAETFFKTTSSIKSIYPVDLVVVENKVPWDSQNPSNYPSHLNPIGLWGRQPQSVAKAWNDGIDFAVATTHTHIIVCNQDIVFKDGCLDGLVYALNHYPEIGLITGTEVLPSEVQAPTDAFGEGPNFSLFAIRPDFFKKVGRFDEHYEGAYCEDNDMHLTMVSKGYLAKPYSGAQFTHDRSSTIRYDSDLETSNNFTFAKNQEYFKTKWGFYTTDTKATEEFVNENKHRRG